MFSDEIRSDKDEDNAEDVLKLVSYCECRRFMIACFKACKVPKSHAEQVADLNLYADYRKHFSLGIDQLELCINDLLENRIDGSAVPKIIKDTLATAWVDGQNSLGAVIGNFCMNLAIEKAEKCGLGLVCAKRSNCCGITSIYTETALKRGFIGVVMCNTVPLMIPTRSKQPLLGANPIGIGVPAKDDKFILHMTPNVVPVGKIEKKGRQSVPMPNGLVQDEEENETKKTFCGGCLIPLGGNEETSGHKGYGLGALVDILSGVLSGANYLTKIKMKDYTEANLGQIFIAINPNFFITDFEDRMADYISTIRSCTPIDPEIPVMLPGDIAENNRKETLAAGGIEYNENQLNTFKKLSIKLKVKPLKFKELENANEVNGNEIISLENKQTKL